MTAPGRDAYAIVADFSAASSRLAAMAGDWLAGQYKATDVSDANTTVEGLRSLLVELRKVAQSPQTGG
jgi:hypothetical protein